MNLGTKIFFVILILMLIASGISGWIVYILNRAQIEASVGQTQLNTTTATLSVIDRFFSERYGDVQIFTRQEPIRSFLSSATTSSTTDISVLENEYRSLINIYGAWDSFLILNPDGETVISTEKEYASSVITPSFPEEYALFTSARDGNLRYSDFFISPITNKPTVAFAAPVRSLKDDGAIIGVGLGYVDWNVVEEILAGAKVDAYLFNTHGEQIATGIRNTASFIQDESHSGIQKALQGTADSALLFNEQKGMDVLASFAQESGYFDYKGNGWVLLLEQSADDVFADAERNAFIIIGLFFLGGIAFAAFAVWLFNLLIVNPIRYLTDATKKIAGGQLNEQVSIDSHDEIGMLANVFNKMTESIQDSQRNLENKVLERTASLDQKIEQLDALNKHMVGRELRMAELKKEVDALKQRLGE